MPDALKDRLAHDLKEAMRARDELRMATLRSLLSAVTTREKEGGGPLAEDDVVAVLQKQARQRRDAAEQFAAAGRADLAERERAEQALIEAYLPAPLTDEEIRRVLEAVVARTGATTKADLGRVMGEAMRELRGRADGNRVRQLAQELLGG